MPSSEQKHRLIDVARTRVRDGHSSVALGALASGTCLGGNAPKLVGRSVLVTTTTQVLAAAAFIELDGMVRRLVITPPDLKRDDIQAFVDDAEVDAVVTDEPRTFDGIDIEIVPIAQSVEAVGERLRRSFDTEWVLATSGTSGRPKLVVHFLTALTGAIAAGVVDGAPRLWATFYDIRRYGGLQIFLRAVFGGTDLVVSRSGEAIADHLRRLGAAGVTSISGTPSHWRRVLMSDAREAINPAYIRLSGEIADQMVLDALRAAYPYAAIGHAYASTEAGVGFAVDDGCEGFPASLLDGSGEVVMKVVDGSLRIRSARTAFGYLGASATDLADADGYVDTGDLVETRGDRCFFVGRRGGIINVGGLKVNPEEVEATINSHRDVRMSLVKARKNALTGAVVVAEIVLHEPDVGSDTIKAEILDLCRARLPAHKVPALVRFVPTLPLTAAGKLSRDPALVVAIA